MPNPTRARLLVERDNASPDRPLGPTCTVGDCPRATWPEAPFEICPEHYQAVVRHFAALQRAQQHETKRTSKRTVNATSRRARGNAGLVYFVRHGDVVKIGTTQDLTQRLTAIPYDELLATIPGGPDVEGQWHRRFAHLRTRGEWFRDAPELRDAIAAARQSP